MAVAGRAYVVREDSAAAEDSGAKAPGNVDRLYPYTLKGLTDALEEARFLSFTGAPQVVAVAAESGIKVIRKYEHGREVAGGDPPGLPLQAFRLLSRHYAKACFIAKTLPAMRLLSLRDHD